MFPFHHFDVLAPIYDKIIKPKSPEDLIKFAGLPTSGRFLDVGGGTGRIAQSIIGLANQIVVVDLSEWMLRQASDKGNLLRICSSSEDLPFPSSNFEKIIMVDAFHHVKNQLQTAKELMRVLKPGGRLVIEEPDIRSFRVKLIAIFEKVALMQSHFFAPLRIANIFMHMGYSIDIQTKNMTVWVIVDKSFSLSLK